MIRSSMSMAVAWTLSLLIPACGGDSGSGPGAPASPEPNEPPLFGDPVTEALHNQPYRYRVAVTDADGDALTIRAPGLPGWMSFDVATATLSGVAGWDNVGSHDVRVTATDGKSPRTQAFTVAVAKGEIVCDQSFGDPATSPYILPFIPGTARTVVEGYCSPDAAAANHNRFAYGFDLQAGDTVLVARDGSVVSVEGSGATGMNVRVRHVDGTVMEYTNLRADPPAPTSGDPVVRGAPLGVAAGVEAGASAGVFVALYRADDLTRKGSLPLNFRNASGPLDQNQALRVGQAYEARPFLEAGRASGVDAIDLANAGDASDVVVTFRRATNEEHVAEYRMIVNKALGGLDLTVESAAGLGPERYVGVPPTGEDPRVVLREDLLDAQGDPIVESTPYRVSVFTAPVNALTTLPALSSPSPIVDLAVTNLVVTLTEPIQAGSGGMEVDSEGNIYAADFGASLTSLPGTRVYKITPEGQVSLWATGLVGASGNAFDSEGHLMQSNIGASSISRIAPDGTVTTYATQGLSNPVGIAIDENDVLYVANCGNNTISRIEPDRSWTTFASGPLFNCPNGIALAEDGNFYVANFGDGAVIQITPSGTASRFATMPGGNNGHITAANGVLYVVARAANQLFELALDGTRRRIAGSGQRGLRDGPAEKAQLSLTNDVAVSPDGRILYFNDVGSLSGTSVISPVIIRMLILEEGN